MDTSYRFSYPCKSISNFYDNFYGIHIYDEIKAVTYRKKKNTNVNHELIEYFELFQMIYTLPIDSPWKQYKLLYKMIIGINYSSEYDEIISLIESDLYDGIFTFVWKEKSNLKEAFIIYLFIQNKISEAVGYSILLPANLKQECDTILEKKNGKYFIKGMFNMIYKPRKYDLKEKIIDKYKKDKSVLEVNNLNEIYLFGSVFKDEYHEFSDIDIIIKYKDGITYEEIFKTKQFITKYNKDNFDRETDIQEYYNYILTHDISNSLRLI